MELPDVMVKEVDPALGDNLVLTETPDTPETMALEEPLAIEEPPDDLAALAPEDSLVPPDPLVRMENVVEMVALVDVEQMENPVVEEREDMVVTVLPDDPEVEEKLVALACLDLVVPLDSLELVDDLVAMVLVENPVLAVPPVEPDVG